MAGDIREFLKQHTWAVVGASGDPDKYGYKVYFQLKNAGYRVYAVNPNRDHIDGDRCYPSLTALPEVPDVVNMVVPPAVTEQVVQECIKLGIRRVWMQPGSESEMAIAQAEKANIEVVANQCVLIRMGRVGHDSGAGAHLDKDLSPRA